MPISEAQKRATMKYMKNNYDDLRIRIPKGRKAELEERVKGDGLSINGLVNRAIREYLGIPEEEWKIKE